MILAAAKGQRTGLKGEPVGAGSRPRSLYSFICLLSYFGLNPKIHIIVIIFR